MRNCEIGREARNEGTEGEMKGEMKGGRNEGRKEGTKGGRRFTLKFEDQSLHLQLSDEQFHHEYPF